jgi:hypothetical protein
MDLHLFKSRSRPVEAFTASQAPDTLPADQGPWDHVGLIANHEEWRHAADKGAVVAGVEINGFFLWDQEGDMAGGERPIRPHDATG